MDFSIILVVPLSVFVSAIWLMKAARAGRPRPRLIWPVAVSTIAVTPLFLRMPAPTELGLWLASWLVIAFWATIGTLVGAGLAKLMLSEG